MKKSEKIIGKLTDGQLSVFRGLQHCLKAGSFAIEVTAKCYDNKEIGLGTAKSFIHEILGELEIRKKLEAQMWDKIKAEFNIGEEFNRLWIDPDTGEIHLLTEEYFKESVNGNIDIRRFDIMWKN